jgi:hypothetical protein
MNIKQYVMIVSALLSAPTWAHHSTAMFDNTQRITVEATVKKLEWTSPHAWLQILVTNDKGEAEEWGLEMGTPAAMMREGWKPRSVVPGEKVTVVLNPLKNGEHGGNLVSVTRADGTLIGQAK